MSYRIRYVVYDIVRPTYDIVRPTYDIVYNIIKTYAVVGFWTVLANRMYDVVYDVVRYIHVLAKIAYDM